MTPMEEFQEADVLWPDTPPPPPWGDLELHLPELQEATAGVDGNYSFVSFGSDMSGPASSSSSSAPSSAPSSGGFLSDPSALASGHGSDDASFQEADVLWPDDGYATRELGADGGEHWWLLCCGFGDDAAAGRGAEPAAGGKRGAWRAPLVSSPIDIPTGVSAARRRRPTAVPVHRRSIYRIERG